MTRTRRPVTAADLHRRAVQVNEAGRPGAARDLLRSALRLDDARGDLLVRVLTTLALAESETGDLATGLALLGRARAALDGVADPRSRHELSGLLHGQRGLLLLRAGRHADAVTELDRAVHQLGWSSLEQSRALLNRGTAALLQGDLPGAARTLQRAARVAARADWPVGEAKAKGNLGYLALLTGDLPEALRLNDEAAVVLTPLGSGIHGVSRLVRAQTLLAAGLLTDADAELAAAGPLLGSGRLHQDRAEADLTRARVALADDRPADARRLARQAARRSRARGAEMFALQCDLIEVQADRAQHRRLHRTATLAAAMAPDLLAQGLTDEARTADLLHLDCLITAGQDVPTPALHRGERIGTRLLARAVRADRAQHRGDHRAASRERATGLRELHRYQARFGSLDLQSGASGLGRRLAEDGLAAAVRAGRPAQVLAWVERARATTSRTPPLRPPADPVAAELLAELRYVRTTLQQAALERREDATVRALRRRRRELERTVRHRAWYSQGHGAIEDPAPLEQIRAGLAAGLSGSGADGTPGAMVSYFAVGADLFALVVTARRTVLRPLGAAAAVVERVQRVRADLDVLALTHLPAPVRSVATTSLRSGLAALQDLVWAPVAHDVGPGEDGPLLVVPCAQVAALPWTALAALRGRPVTVAPSATWWLSARARGTTVADGASAVFVAGPGVERGPAEVRAAAAVWAGSTLLTGDDAVGPTVLDAADGTDVWHIAAHGVHDRENPLFSSVTLADGALFGYDLDRVERLPRHVVLSACDLGLATVRRRDEAVGMTAALLHGGTVSVVAGMARVGDEAASRVGVAFHEGLRAGLDTSVALARALADGTEPDGPPAPLVCLGAGW